MPAAPTAGDGGGAPAETQIELDYWYIWGGRGGEGQVAGCDLFTEQNPNIIMHPLTAGGVIVDKTLAAFAAGDPPDLVDLILVAPLIFLTRQEYFTIALGLTYFLDRDRPLWYLAMAGNTMAVLPVILVFILAQRAFIEGITLTGTKG